MAMTAEERPAQKQPAADELEYITCDDCARSFPRHLMVIEKGRYLCPDCLLESLACGCEE